MRHRLKQPLVTIVVVGLAIAIIIISLVIKAEEKKTKPPSTSRNWSFFRLSIPSEKLGEGQKQNSVESEKQDGKQVEPQTPPLSDGANGLDSLVQKKWLFDMIVRVEQERQHRRMVWRINTWLSQRGSPMAGCGEYYVRNSERTGIPACLPVGIAEAESSSGMACFAPHNAFGMLAYPGGWDSWEDAIYANFDWLVHYYGCPQSMYECHGYCEGNTTMDTVNSVQRYIEGIDASWIQ